MRRKIDERFEQRKKPRLPREYCTSWKNWLLGIVSPSRRMVLYDLSYEVSRLKYKVYKRTATREEWKLLWNYCKHSEEVDDEV